jgi:hypothetical protein
MNACGGKVTFAIMNSFLDRSLQRVRFLLRSNFSLLAVAIASLIPLVSLEAAAKSAVGITQEAGPCATSFTFSQLTKGCLSA